MAEEVAEPAAQQEEPTKGDQVRVHNPCERGFGEPEILTDGWKRDAYDRHVEHDHQVAQAEDDESEPASPRVHFHEPLSFMSLSSPRSDCR